MNDRSALFVGYLVAASLAFLVLCSYQGSFHWAFVHISVLILVMLGTGLWRNLHGAFRAVAGAPGTDDPRVWDAGRKAVWTTQLLNLTLGSVGVLGGLVPWLVLPGKDPVPYLIFGALSLVTTVAGWAILRPVGRAIDARRAAE